MAAILMAVDQKTQENLEAVKRRHDIGHLTKDQLASHALGEILSLADSAGKVPPQRHLKKTTLNASVGYLTALLDELTQRFEYDKRHPRI